VITQRLGSIDRLDDGKGVDLPHLAIVMPTRGKARFMPAALTAVLDQRYEGTFQVTVISNAADSGSYRRVLPLRGDGYTAVHIQARNKSEAVNVGIRHTRGDALVFLDDDDFVQQGYLQHMGEALTRYDAVGARLDSAVLNPGTYSRRNALQAGGLPRLMGRPFIIGAGLGVRRSAFEAVGGYDEALDGLEDVDLSWRLADAGYSLGFVPRAVLWYRYRSSVRDTYRQERMYGQYEAALYAKHRKSVPPRRLRNTAGAWGQVPRQVARGNWYGAVTATGHSVGRLRGSLRHHVAYL
jgi:GT2 family glycosyltransferase